MITEESAANEAKIIELRRQRLPWREIATIVNMSHEGARKCYNRALGRYPAEQLAILRIEEGESLDEAMRHLRVLALSADSERNRIEAWRAFILASESKRKLYGCDAPVRREIEVLSNDFADARWQAELSELEAQVRAAENR